MGNYDDDGFDDLDNRGAGNGGGGLRKQLEDALAKNRELTAEVSKLRTSVNTTTLRDVLQKKSLRPGLARAMVKDGVDASDPKAVDDWLAEPNNQEDYGFSLEAGTDASSGTQTTEGGSAADEAAAQFAQFQAAQNNALPADPNKLAGAARLMESAKTDDEIAAALAAAVR